MPSAQLSEEFKVYRSTYRSAKGLAEHLRDRAKRNLAKAAKTPKTVFHVIRPQFCEMLGIDPDEMIAVSLSQVWADKFEAEIHSGFDRLPDSMLLPDRILEAHAKAYGVGFRHIMALVKDGFFVHTDRRSLR